MARSYSISEAFHLAETIERNGLAFYTQAAAATRDPRVRAIFASLAQAEQHHADLFEGLRQEYCRTEEIHQVDLDDQVAGYINAVAACHVFNLEKDVTRLLASVQTPESALRLALNFEKDTLAFFAALRDGVALNHRDKVDRLIREELDHVHQLQQALTAP